jgi:hypothetical protein
MKTTSASKFLVTLFLLSCGWLHAQSATPAVSTDPVDREWDALRMAAYAPNDARIQSAQDAASLKVAIAEQSREFTRRADAAKQFYTKNPSHPKAMAARKLEALMLVNAVQSGETALEGRMDDAALTFSTDPEVPEADRAEVAGTRAFINVARKNLQGAERQTALENISRSLILSFPKQPQGYESLFTLAREADEVKSKALLQDLSGPATPPAIRLQVRNTLDRYDLVGKPLDELVVAAGTKEARATLKPGRPTLVYTWATWSPGSLALGELLSKRNVKAVNVVGVNLDTDTAAAAAAATAHGLAGFLQYDARGTEGALARGLRADGAPLIYLIDADGVIRDVRGADDLEKKLSKYGL